MDTASRQYKYTGW